MEDLKEENVEYHIEIQKCEEGNENNDGEVMYVLDFGGADIPENLAMSIAQWAADSSLSLEDGNNSFVVQNNGGVELASQVMQVDSGNNIIDGSNGSVDGEVPQVIHVKLEDGSDYIMDDTAAGIPDDSIVYSVQDDSSVIHIEKPSMGGRIEPRPNSNISNSLLNIGQVGNIQIQNPDGTQTTLISRKPFVVRNENTKVERKSGKSLAMGQSLAKNNSSISGSNNKGADRLPITPFLKGKTPVMLMVDEDGQVSTDVTSLPPIKIESTKKVETSENTTDTEKSNNIPSTNDVREPMILDFPTEKSKLDNSLRVVANMEKSLSLAVNVTAGTTTSSKEEISGETDSNPKTQTENVPTTECKKEELSLNTSVNSDLDKNDDVQDDSLNNEVKEEMSGENEENEDDDLMEVTETEDLPEKPDKFEETEKTVKHCTYENCEFLSSDPSSYASHLESEHDDLTPHVCFECDKTFKLNLSLKIHQIFHMKDARPAKKKRGPYGARDKFYYCPMCSFKNKYKREAQLHINEEHAVDKTYTCESCKFICLTQMELDHHNEVVTHRTDNKNYCDICNQLFTNIYQHRAAVHTNDRPHCCTECGYKAKTKSSLRYHMVTHLTTKDWQCSKCPYKTTTERRLKRHMKIHDPNKKHICNLCSFATHDSYEYKRHHIKVHSKTKTYTCKFCEQKFDKHHEIRLHLMFEHDCNDAFFCNHCDFTCSTRADYKEHIQTHYGKHRHVCEICGFTGRYKTHYRRHMLTHSDEKPFECKICGKKVSEASNLRRHMLTHSEDKPLACSVCGYRCKIRSRLMNHMKTHSELRPFACHLCKYTTKFNGNLMKHLENHAKYKPHKCQYCSYSCNEKNKLKRHMAFRHKGVMEPKQEISDEHNEESEMNTITGVDVSNKEIISTLPSKDQILLLPNKELVIVQGDHEERIVLPVDENGLVMASADQGDLMAQLESGSVVLTVEDVPPASEQDVHKESSVSVLTESGETAESIVVLRTEG